MEFIEYGELLLIFPIIALYLCFKVFVLNKAKRMDSGLFSVWIETETINDHQIKIIKKYSFFKWRYFTLVIYKTDKEYYNKI